MSLITPTEGRRRVADRVEVPVEVTFADPRGDATLSLRHPPTPMLVTITNRSARTLVADAATTFSVTMRPRTIVDLRAVTIAADADVSWLLHPPHAAGEAGSALQTLAFSPRAPLALAPGESWHVGLRGLAGDPVGGSRRTRVQLAYAGLGVRGPAETAVAERIDGQVVRHLSLRRADDAALALRREVRSGSTATFGPFTAGFLQAPALLNDGKALNRMTLRIANTSGRPLRLSDDDDTATRFVLDYRIGGDPVLSDEDDTATRFVLDHRIDGDPAPWGLLRSRHDHLTVTTSDDGWATDGVNVRRVGDGAWSPREALDLELEIHTSAPDGTAQLVVRFENLPDEDDGELVLLVDIAGTADNAFVEPLELWGLESAIEFHQGEYLAVPEDPPAASVALDHAADPSGADRPPLKIRADLLDLDGPTRVRGALTVDAPVTAPSLRLTEYTRDGDGATLVIGDTGRTNLRLGATAAYSWIQSHGSRQLAVNPLGNNVGIRTTEPEQALDVNGDTRVRGSLTAEGATRLAGALTVEAATRLGGALGVEGATRLGGALGVEGATRLGGALTVEERATAQRVRLTEYTDNANGATQVIGDTRRSNLRLGVTDTYSWIQSHGSRPLAINPLGNNVGIRTTAPRHALDVNGDLGLPRGWTILVTSGGGQLSFRYNGEAMFFIDNEGRTANRTGWMRTIT